MLSVALGGQFVPQMPGPWSLAYEVLLAGKGGRRTDGGIVTNADVRTLDLSLLVHWHAAARGTFVFAGPTGGYVLSCRYRGGNVITSDCTDELAGLDAGLTLGAGVEFPSDTRDWGVSLRYQHGLLDLPKASEELRTRTTMLLVSYRLKRQAQRSPARWN